MLAPVIDIINNTKKNTTEQHALLNIVFKPIEIAIKGVIHIQKIPIYKKIFVSNYICLHLKAPIPPIL